MESPTLGMLISISWNADDWLWSTVATNMRFLLPQFSSLTIDCWNRPRNVSVPHVRQLVQGQHASVLELFGRVIFLNTGPRAHWPKHAIPNGAYYHNWMSAFLDALPPARSGSSGLEEDIPQLLIGVDADFRISRSLPLRNIFTSLDQQPRPLQSSSERSTLDAESWSGGASPPTCPADCPRLRRYPLLTPWPVHILAETPRYQRMAAFTERDVNAAGLGQRCCTQSPSYPGVAAPESLRESLNASAAYLSRGPWCPSSQLWMLHRRELGWLRRGLRLWATLMREEERVRRQPRRAFRLEYVLCRMLALDEAALFAFYPEDSASGGSWGHTEHPASSMLPDSRSG